MLVIPGLISRMHVVQNNEHCRYQTIVGTCELSESSVLGGSGRAGHQILPSGSSVGGVGSV